MPEPGHCFGNVCFLVVEVIVYQKNAHFARGVILKLGMETLKKKRCAARDFV